MTNEEVVQKLENIRADLALVRDWIRPAKQEESTEQTQSTGEIDSGFRLGIRSLTELEGVKPELVTCVKLAITLSIQDFTVFDGLRTDAEQKLHVEKGVSKTLKSKHLKQADGFGHAVDLVPWVDGKPVWNWNLIWPIAHAMDQAATKLGLAEHIRWGGAWDRRLSDFGGDVYAYKAECAAYSTRHEGSDFLDGPHFEWVD